VLQLLLAGPPPPLLEIAPDTPPELATIVTKAMARDAAARYPTARELVDDLRQFQNGNLIATHRYSFGHLFRRWVRKHRGALVVAVAAFVALGVIGGVSISRVIAANREAQRERDEARDQQKLAIAAQQRAEESESHARKSEARVMIERDRQRFVRERRVELDHFKHTQLDVPCNSCHVIDPKTFTAKDGTPGHEQCSACHDKKLMDGTHGEEKCAFCHLDRPAPGKDMLSLRACDDAAVMALEKTGGTKSPCFRHDLKQHRIGDDGKPLECTNCHGVLADKSLWKKNRTYNSLQDLDVNPIIGGRGTQGMHVACGTGCHYHEEHMALDGGNCALCHPKGSGGKP